MSERPPGSRSDRMTVVPSASFTQNQTVPTGLSAVPPPGPAIPVIADARCRRRNGAAPPAAIASATACDTAPCPSISAASTPNKSIFASLA